MHFRKKYIVIILLASLLYSASCSKSDNTANIIHKDTLSVILADIHFADAILAVKMNSEKFLEINEYYNQILTNHNVNRADFDSSVNYYSKRTEEFKEIYEDVMFLLSKKEGEILALPDDDNNKVKSDFEVVLKGKNTFDKKQRKYIFSNERSSVVSSSDRYSMFISKSVKNTDALEYSIDKPIKEIKVSLDFKLSVYDYRQDIFPSIIIEVVDGERKVLFRALDIRKNMDKDGEWNHVKINSKFRLKNVERKGVVRIYISNSHNTDLFIDDFIYKLEVK